MFGIAHDDVVEDFDFEKLAGSNETAGDVDDWILGRLDLICVPP